MQSTVSWCGSVCHPVSAKTEKISPPAISVEFRTKFYENNRKLQIKLHLKLRRDRRVVCTASGSSGVPARVHAMAAERSLAAERCICRLLEEYRDGSRAMAASSSAMPHTTASTPLKTRSGASSFSGTAMRKRLRSSSAQHVRTGVFASSDHTHEYCYRKSSQSSPQRYRARLAKFSKQRRRSFKLEF